ncbi:MAG: 16S rRNA (guanine(527)-N(7))-methyltransferase RsmG [Proteobacteria bacterium]|nr:16S rRNA (guanine(527)-N(7))-methyltransferase RsmG [Pseudomonadota bacterium]
MSGVGVAVDVVRDGAAELGVTLTDRQFATLDAYLALLAKWNRVYNLTAIRDIGEMRVQHALDALAVLPHLPDRPGQRVLDVGAGGGIPGLVFAIARPHWHLTLIDVVQKKTAFLTQAAIELGLANVDVALGRVEEWRAPLPYAIIVSRAYAELRTFVAGSAHLLAPGGAWYAMKGIAPDAEIAALPTTVRVVANTPLTVPGLGAARHLVEIVPLTP